MGQAGQACFDLGLEAFFALRQGPLTKVTFADLPGTLPIVMFDASTTGGGGPFVDRQCGGCRLPRGFADHEAVGISGL